MVPRVSSGAIALAALLLAGASCGRSRSPLHGPGRAHLLDGRLEEAVRALEPVVSGNPPGEEGALAGLYLGKAYLGLGRLDEARRTFRETADRFPETEAGDKCRYKEACAALMAGDQDEALRLFRALDNRGWGLMAPEAGAFVQALERR